MEREIRAPSERWSLRFESLLLNEDGFFEECSFESARFMCQVKCHRENETWCREGDSGKPCTLRLHFLGSDLIEKRQRAVVDSHFSSPPILLVCDSDQTLRPESQVGQSLRILAAILD